MKGTRLKIIKSKIKLLSLHKYCLKNTEDAKRDKGSVISLKHWMRFSAGRKVRLKFSVAKFPLDQTGLESSHGTV